MFLNSTSQIRLCPQGEQARVADASAQVQADHPPLFARVRFVLCLARVHLTCSLGFTHRRNSVPKENCFTGVLSMRSHTSFFTLSLNALRACAAALLLVLGAGARGPAQAQSLSLDRGRCQDMLKVLKDDIKNNYYD